MKKICLLVIIISLLLVNNIYAQKILRYGPNGVSISYATFDPDSTAGLSDAELFYYVLGINSNNTFECIDTTYAEDTSYSYKTFIQKYMGFPVEYTLATIAYHNNSIIRFSGYYLPINNLDLTVNHDSLKAIAAYIDYYQVPIDTSIHFYTEQLIIEDTNSQNLGTLCYKVVCDYFPVHNNILYISPIDLSILRADSTPQSGFGTLHTRYNGTRQATTTFNSGLGLYYLQDYDYGVRVLILNSDENITTSGDTYYDDDNIWPERLPPLTSYCPDYALDAYWAAEMYTRYIQDNFDFTKENFQIRDDEEIPNNEENLGITSIYIAQQGSYSDDTHWGRELKGSSLYNREPGHPHWVNIIYIGSDGTDYKPLSSIDEVVHEFAHIFSWATWHYCDHPDEYNPFISLRLAEACADIWAAIITYQVYSDPDKVYKIGEDVVDASGKECVRNMINPQSTNAEIQMDACYSSAVENHDEYEQSGIISHWFYLLTRGGSGENCSGKCYNVEGITMEQAAKLMYHCEKDRHFQRALDFEEIRQATIDAAGENFSNNPEVLLAVCNAWDAVGVYEPSNETSPENYGLSYETANAGEYNISGNINVETGMTLTITGTVHFGADVSLTIKPGGTLIVDGGILTSQTCNNELWGGVELLGQSTQGQTTQHQGLIQLINGGTIENAHIGISTWDGSHLTTTGGIIRADGAIFRNNVISVQFKEYRHYFNNNEIDNVSYFVNCDFIIDNENLISENYPNIRVMTYMTYLNGVRGIKFKGCRFEYTSSVSLTGIGINALDAGFTVNEYCPGDYYNCICTETSTRSSFEGFATAINVSNSGSEYTFTVDNSNFINNNIGVKSNAVQNFSIIRSNFNLPFNSQKAIYGIYLSSSSGFTIEENHLYCLASGFRNKTYPCGIYILNSGASENIIYRNTVDSVGFGIYADGNNYDPLISQFDGLQFQCNKFYYNYTDIFNNGTIRPIQGNYSKGADNEFQDDYTIWNIYNNNYSFEIKYFYSNSYIYNPNPCHYNIQQNLGYPIWTNFDAVIKNPCKSTICSGSGGSTSKGINAYYTLYDSLKCQYENAITQFFTAGYDQLLDDFYNTSVSSSLNTAYSNSSLSPAIQYFIRQAKIQLGNILSLNQRMAYLSDTNIRKLMADSLLSYTALENWYSRVSTPISKYALVWNYYNNDDYAQAESTLQSISGQFDFNFEESAEYDNFVALYNFKDRIRLSGRKLSQLTDSEITELNEIALNTNGLSSTMAKGVLCFFYDICYEDSLSETGSERHLFIPYNEDNIKSDIPNVVIFPNPAENQVNVVFNSLFEEVAVFNLYDVMGHQLNSYNLKNANSTIDIRNLTSGIYFYRVYYKNSIIDQGKLVKQ